MIRYKKIIMTLALLLTAVGGAWAQDTYTITFSANGKNKAVENVTLPKTYQCSYNNANGELDLILKELYGWTGNATGTYCDNYNAPTSSDANKVVAGQNGNDDYITINNVFEGTVTITGSYYVNGTLTPYSLEIYFGTPAPATFPFPITWDATNKTTGFNLPAGNVFMNVEYYPVAELTTAPTAKSNIKATTADAIVEAGTVKMIGQTENAQGTLMYYAVQSETAPEAPDYDNKGWSDKVPTAADFNQGNVYVWYYVKGADGDAESTFNDGAITKLGESGYVTLAALTYAITLKEDTEEADKWTISPAEAIKGTTITATYTGSKKVIGVKAEKKAAGLTYPIALSAVTEEYTGSVVTTDGNVYATVAAATAASKTAVAIIAYVGSSTGDATYNHGLAIALSNEGNMNWLTAKSACEGKAAVTGAKWYLPSRDNWAKMIAANGGNQDNYSELNTKLETASGEGSKLPNGDYWTSTNGGDISEAYIVSLSNGSANFSRIDYKEESRAVRACLAF